jgi:SAM-dependent methyltransferase
METLKQCPLCLSSDLKPFIECTDYTVSKKMFTISECIYCNFRFTNPRPSEDEAGGFYESEDYISHSETKKGIINRAYHVVRKFTLSKKLNLVRIITQKSKGRLLDIGCGTGAFLALCRDKGWQVKGMEPSISAREYARSHYKLELSGADSWSEINNGTIDAITGWHVLEHIYRIDETIAEIKRILTKDGVLILALPNCSSADAEFYGKYWAAYDVPRHIWHFKPNDVKRYFEERGFVLSSVLPMPWDAFYICMLSEKYKTGSVNYGRALVHGWASNRKAKKQRNASESPNRDTWSSQIYVLKKK